MELWPTPHSFIIFFVAAILLTIIERILSCTADAALQRGQQINDNIEFNPTFEMSIEDMLRVIPVPLKPSDVKKMFEKLPCLHKGTNKVFIFNYICLYDTSYIYMLLPHFPFKLDQNFSFSISLRLSFTLGIKCMLTLMT